MLLSRTYQLLAREKGWTKYRQAVRKEFAATKSATYVGASVTRALWADVPADEFSFCMLGGVTRAANELAYEHDLPNFQRVRLMEEAEKRLAAAIKKLFKFKSEFEQSSGVISDFNDRSKTRKKDVLEVVCETLPPKAKKKVGC